MIGYVQAEELFYFSKNHFVFILFKNEILNFIVSN